MASSIELGDEASGLLVGKEPTSSPKILPASSTRM